MVPRSSLGGCRLDQEPLHLKLETFTKRRDTQPSEHGAMHVSKVVEEPCRITATPMVMSRLRFLVGTTDSDRANVIEMIEKSTKNVQARVRYWW